MKLVFAFFCLGFAWTALDADEGYWLFTDPPTAAIADKYHFTPDAAWLDHLRGAVLRIGGASGAFVSADGLVITNRHVGEGVLHTLSSGKHDYEADGFCAPALSDELPCEGLEMLVPQQTQDVTARVLAAVKPGATPEEAEAAHKAVEAAIEKESFDQTGLESEVVTLFGGARYDLYQYKKYSDIRLVFSPDRQAASFGGDPDNFEFPRFDLDICFFRIYEHGKPLQTDDYLKWNSAGPARDQLVFVAGHPGSSQRLVTMDEINYQRDVRLPIVVDELDRMERELRKFSATSPEHAREASEAVASVANSRKANHGFLNGLRNRDLLQSKAAEEAAFRAQLAQHPEEKDALDAYARIREAVAADRDNFKAYEAYERFAYRSDLFNMARTLVRAAAERAKPNGERLPAYRDSNLPSLEFRLFSGRPYYPDLEVFFLADGLENLVNQYGENDPLVQNLLAGETPQARAGELVRQTKIEAIAVRKKLYAGGERAIQSGDDPLLDFAAAMDSAARTARKIDDTDDETKRRAYARIYQARVDLNRAPLYPDATDTLRLAYGTVSGWQADGKLVEPLTDFAGLYARSQEHNDEPPFDLPQAWVEQKSKLDLTTPFNFITTVDILGGNSGSPVVNTDGEFVGIIFDGNEPSLAGRYVYDPAQNRSVAVDSAAIIEALRRIYHADALATELESGHVAP
ncbi:MAG: S46 family peptidase [Methylacidiphilales bacterium]|nr:S46 family peptidase [Candidatus Methylacidiphilales bacterium]